MYIPEKKKRKEGFFRSLGKKFTNWNDIEFFFISLQLYCFSIVYSLSKDVIVKVNKRILIKSVKNYTKNDIILLFLGIEIKKKMNFLFSKKKN